MTSRGGARRRRARRARRAPRPPRPSPRACVRVGVGGCSSTSRARSRRLAPAPPAPRPTPGPLRARAALRDDEPRESKLVFIGKNLDAKALAAGFDACLATPKNLKRKAEGLRFPIGEKVECNTGDDGWAPGVVVAHMYRDSQMPEGMVAPYQVQLDEDGCLIWAPHDCDSVIRRRAKRSRSTSSVGQRARARTHSHS